MNKLFAILIMCALSLPSYAIAGEEVETAPVNADNVKVSTVNETEEAQSFTDVQEPDTVSVPEALPSRYKEPVSKKTLAKKFIIAMLCVVGTSIFLYGSLSIYNKIKEGLSLQANNSPEGETPLEAPSDLSEAVKTFVEKTNWNN